jgi:hypothetical protein
MSGDFSDTSSERDAMRTIGAAVVAAVLSAGCANAPSINILGAYFPDWLLCIVAGVVLAIVCYVVLQRTHFGDMLGPSAVAYPALTTLFALVVWLIFFQP